MWQLSFIVFVNVNEKRILELSFDIFTQVIKHPTTGKCPDGIMSVWNLIVVEVCRNWYDTNICKSVSFLVLKHIYIFE